MVGSLVTLVVLEVPIVECIPLYLVSSDFTNDVAFGIVCDVNEILYSEQLNARNIFEKLF